MTNYDDDAVCLDEQGLTIKNYLYRRRPRFIAYDTIRSAVLIDIGTWSGRHRLVGVGFRRPRHFFHWDANRSTKTAAIELDTGRRIKIVITPEDPGRVLSVLEQQIADAETN